MSKLDYVTIAIVAACVLAIAFLIYKMTDLFQSKDGKDKIEVVADTVETDDDVYDYEIDYADSTGATTTDEAPQTQTGTTTPATIGQADKTTATDNSASASSTSTVKVNPTNTYSSNGRFLVIAGTFEKMINAESQAKNLRKKGYQYASVEIFDRGKFALILVDRFTNMAEAENLAKKLKADGVECYVKMQEGQ